MTHTVFTVLLSSNGLWIYHFLFEVDAYLDPVARVTLLSLSNTPHRWITLRDTSNKKNLVKRGEGGGKIRKDAGKTVGKRRFPPYGGENLYKMNVSTTRGFTRIIREYTRDVSIDVWIVLVWRGGGCVKDWEEDCCGSDGKIGEKEAAVIQQCHRAHRAGEINEMHFHAYLDTSPTINNGMTG